MNAHTVHRLPQGLLVLAIGVLALLAVASPASADSVIGSPGSGAGQYEGPRGVAVDNSNGHVYVADTGNSRIDVFDSADTFLFAFGWKVNATAPEEKLQTCTPATGCQKGSSGSGAGQFEAFGPQAIAVDSSSHAVYVSETNNHRLQKFDSEGHFAWMAGGEVDQVSHANLCTVAVNCGAGKASSPIGQEGFFFSTLGQGLPVSVGPGGIVYVADSKKLGVADSEGFNTRVQHYEADGTHLGPQLILPGKVDRVAALVVDSAGSLYVSDGGGDGGVRKFDSAGSPVTSWGENGRVSIGPSAYSTGLALDPAGDLFVATALNQNIEIHEYDDAGTQTRIFFPAVRRGLFAAGGLAYDDGTGDLFLTEQSGGGSTPDHLLRVVPPPPGPLLVPGSAVATPIGSVRATLNVSFNSQGKPSHARFQYIAKAAYEANLAAAKEGFFGAATTPNSPDTPADFENHTVQATNVCAVPTEATCLQPETTYYFRALAENAEGTVTGEKTEFTTRPPLEVVATWSGEVGTETASLLAQVNPFSIAATGHFQYIEEGADYQANGFEHALTTLGELDFGHGEAPVLRSAQINGLKAGTIYHYRLIASDAYFPAIASGTHSFTTFALPEAAESGCSNQPFRSGAAAALPDCRAYELVSPLDKSNGDIRTLLDINVFPTFLDQSSTDGSAFTYSSYRAFANPVSAPYTNQLLARRHERGQPREGWQSEGIDPKGKGAELLENPYRVFSQDLSVGLFSWISEAGEAPPDPCTPIGYPNLYRRDNQNGSFEALSCAPIEHNAVNPRQYLPEVQGLSSDGAKTVFRADEALVPGASEATTVNPNLRPVYQLYEASTGAKPRLVSVLPSGEASGLDSSAGTGGETNATAYWNINRHGNVMGAVSEDATRVFWSQTPSGSLGPLFLRINADQAQSKVEAGKCSQPTRACTIRVSETVTPAPVRFQGANPQGTKALFTVESGPLKGSLYEFDSEAELPSSQPIGEGVVGNILGASADLSRVYFASEAASATQQSEGATAGQPNVYLYDEGTTRFVATLSNGGGETSDVDNQFGTPIATTPILRTARVSVGGALVFMSNSGPLAEAVAGYDNTDAKSGQADAEVYRYDPDAGAGALACLSCNPSGARPLGREIEKGNNGKVGPWGAATIPRFQSMLYQPRYLSDDGSRVFFNSFDPLVLADTNGKQDVYEWEAAGTGGCTSNSPSYLSSSEGCLSLISSGQSPGDSEFLDASPTGSDAFFTTVESLLGQDYGLIDVYDARIGGGFPPPPNPPAACEGEACQGPLTPPNDPTPASAAFHGAGNLREEPKARCAKGKARRKGRCGSAKKHKSAAKSKHKANHERRAGR
jgi:DNA-binding beta-propeller fold protein YncE